MVVQAKTVNSNVDGEKNISMRYCETANILFNIYEPTMPLTWQFDLEMSCTRRRENGQVLEQCLHVFPSKHVNEVTVVGHTT